MEEENLTDREMIELIEDDLIDLIRSTTHHSALELLTQALVRVRGAAGYLEGDSFPH